MTNRLSIEQELRREYLKAVTRRQLFRRCNSGLGAVALASLLGNDLLASPAASAPVGAANPLSPKPAQFAP